MADSAMRTVVSWIVKEDHLVLQSFFNLFSTHKQNAILAGQLLMMGAQQFYAERTGEGIDGMDAEAHLRIIDWETRRRMQNQAVLNSVVARGGLSEREADVLHGIAEQLDLDEEEAAELAKGSPFASAVAQSYNGTKSGRCQRWLIQVMSEHRSGVPRTDVMSEGERRGFSESMMDAVSRRLKITKEKQKGGAWHWFPPSGEDSDDDTEEAAEDPF